MSTIMNTCGGRHKTVKCPSIRPSVSSRSTAAAAAGGFAVWNQVRWAWASARRGKLGQLTPLKNKWKIKKRKHAKKSSFLCLCYIVRAIRAGRCRERRYADHIFIQIYFRMHHFVFKFFFASGGKGALITLTKILQTFLTWSPRSAKLEGTRPIGWLHLCSQCNSKVKR